jgi:hypothetical protein
VRRSLRRLDFGTINEPTFWSMREVVGVGSLLCEETAQSFQTSTMPSGDDC